MCKLGHGAVSRIAAFALCLGQRLIDCTAWAQAAPAAGVTHVSRDPPLLMLHRIDWKSALAAGAASASKGGSCVARKGGHACDPGWCCCTG